MVHVCLVTVSQPSATSHITNRDHDGDSLLQGRKGGAFEEKLEGFESFPWNSAFLKVRTDLHLFIHNLPVKPPTYSTEKSLPSPRLHSSSKGWSWSLALFQPFGTVTYVAVLKGEFSRVGCLLASIFYSVTERL